MPAQLVDTERWMPLVRVKQLERVKDATTFRGGESVGGKAFEKLGRKHYSGKGVPTEHLG